MIWKKLRSKRGASLSFALLLFLVCVVIGSVVLAAGTAASGRLSKLADMDQRYYAVTSAAELFKDELDGQTVLIERTRTVTYNAIYQTDSEGNTVVDSSGNPVVDHYEKEYHNAPSYMAVGKNITTVPHDSTYEVKKDTSVLTDAAIYLVFGSPDADFENSWQREYGLDDEHPFPPVNMTVKTDKYNPALTVNVTANMSEDGELSLLFSSPGSKNVFSLKMVLILDASVSNTDTSKKTFLKWELSDIKKV